jgi:hypothetical protein
MLSSIFYMDVKKLDLKLTKSTFSFKFVYGIL